MPKAMAAASGDADHRAGYHHPRQWYVQGQYGNDSLLNQGPSRRRGGANDLRDRRQLDEPRDAAASNGGTLQ